MKREFTWLAAVTGAVMAVVFGAANAYLGLRVGMTISASIPAAVVSMGLYRYLYRRDSILENNMVQTVASAGESLSAGMIFTMPAVFLWAKEGFCTAPGMLELTVIALAGGVLGTLFMIPLRRQLVEREADRLKFPEGLACADILRAGEKNAKGAKDVFLGLGAAAAFRAFLDLVKAIPPSVTLPLRFLKTELALEFSPALLGVGYIVGFRVSTLVFSGTLLAWLVIIPLLVFSGYGDIAKLHAEGGAGAVWNAYIRYIGAGAIATGGFLALAKSVPLFVKTFRESFRGGGNGEKSGDLPMKTVIGGTLATIAFVWAVPQVPVGLGGAVLIAIFGFFFASVSSRMVAYVGSSNNPISGMTIATLVVASLAFKATGVAGAAGMTAVMAVGSVVCVIASMAGDTAQDLKTGYLVGATPWKQQLGEFVGAGVSAVAVGGTLYLLDAAWGYGSGEISAPQAMLMKMIVEGVMGGSLPWSLLFVGAGIALVLALCRVPVMPFAIGMYLPFGTTAVMFLGGILRAAVDRVHPTSNGGRGTLFAAGLVAGEGVAGILLALLALL